MRIPSGYVSSAVLGNRSCLFGDVHHVLFDRLRGEARVPCLAPLGSDHVTRRTL